MQCETFESRIHTLLDQRHPIDVDTSLAQHAKECPACCQLLADYSAVLAPKVLGAVAVAPPENLADQVLSELQPRQTSKTRRSLSRYRRLVATLAVAASLLIAAYTWFDDPQNLDRTGSSGMFGSSTLSSTEAEARQIVALLPLLESLNQQGVETVCRVTGRSMATLPSAVWQVTRNSPHNRPLATQSPWTQSVASGIRPLALSMVSAFDALRSTLPSRSDSPNDSASPSTDTSQRDAAPGMVAV